MKKYLLAFFFTLSTFSLGFTQQSISCLDFSTNLSRGAESGTVLKLQQFLSAKGLLKVAPNGYFGPSTLAAVKAYQKSKGLLQVGNTGPATRAAIKKDSCTQQASVPSASAVAPHIQVAPSTAHTVQVFVPRPMIDSFEFVTLFAGGITDWGFAMYGTNFSTSSNVVTMRNPENRKTYIIGTLQSATGTMLMMPVNFTGTAYSCGTGCLEKLPAGTYEVMVETQGGQSDIKNLSIRAFTITAQTKAISTLSATKIGNYLALLSFGTSIPVTIQSVSFSTGSSTISSSGLGNITLKDEVVGASFIPNTMLPAYNSALIGAYGDTNNTTPGTIAGAFTVKVQDFVGKKSSVFSSPYVWITVAGVL